MFRGREMAHPELGRRILEKVAERVAEIAIVESAPKQDGRNMTMVLNPIRKPKTKPAAQAAGPPSERTDRNSDDAEDEDAPRRGQALQGHRDRQDPAPQGVPGPPARAQAVAAAPAGSAARPRSTGGDKKRVERMLGR